MATTTALPADIFDVQVNVPLIHQVVAAQLAAARQGTHSTKTRGLVSGGGKKPYRQKGTGRARQGSTRAPQFAGGGVVHGPQPRDYSQRTPKKMKAAALRGALSDRARNGRIHVIDVLVSGDAPSTSTAAAVLAGLTDRTKFLVVLERGDQVGLKSVRNLDSVHVLAVDQLNTYDVLCADDVVFTAGALATLTASSKAAATAPVAATVEKADKAEKPAKVENAEKPAKAEKAASLVDAAEAAPAPKATKAAKVAEVVEAPAEAAAELPAGAAAPLADGSAPEGYSVKGNADSGLYHEPDGRWYDATVAEFWFKSAADAEAAGFKKAGSRAKSTAKDGEDAK
ncbi:MAG TPA: 50S ribosomal protein L4 [Dermatophilaceae bacterium]|nr:50S ribosomal protein L4 [Dermatophilaceae bacterium]HOR14681.1 50S ribosomal protein L4 [Dermatophilaceae bacterium]HQG10819.1 50S ribosomal protein L4 [Dermatophilaceae bacterium]